MFVTLFVVCIGMFGASLGFACFVHFNFFAMTKKIHVRVVEIPSCVVIGACGSILDGRTKEVQQVMRVDLEKDGCHNVMLWPLNFTLELILGLGQSRSIGAHDGLFFFHDWQISSLIVVVLEVCGFV